MPWSESALMVLKSWAIRNRLENTENCTMKARTCSRVCSPRLNQAVYGFPVMMRWCSNSLSMRLWKARKDRAFATLWPPSMTERSEWDVRPSR